MNTKTFTADALKKQLTQYKDMRQCTLVIAYSGGLDSHVLLHSAAQINPRVRAIHVNHNLHDDAYLWESHCQRICADLHIPLQCITVNAKAKPGESPEAAARNARYQAFGHTMTQGDVLLTAHHQDDQAETLLLQLLRGAGLKGLSAMDNDC